MKRFAIIAILLSLTTLASACSTLTYVDPLNGNDLWDGSSPTYIGGTQGPKATIENAQENAYYCGEVILADGIYFVQQQIPLRANMVSSSGNPEDCVITFDNNINLFQNNNSYENFRIKDITFTGKIRQIISYGYGAKLLFDNCRFEYITGDYNLLFSFQDSASITFKDCILSDLNVSDYSLIFLVDSGAEIIFVNTELSKCAAQRNIIYSNSGCHVGFINSTIKGNTTTLIRFRSYYSKVFFENSSILFNPVTNDQVEPLIDTQNLEIYNSKISFNRGRLIRAGSNLKIIDSTISNNNNEFEGQITAQNAEIRNCNFKSNIAQYLFHATDQYSQDVDSESIFKIDHTEFTDNSLNSFFLMQFKGATSITDSQIIGNNSYSLGEGYADECHVNLANVLFAKNTGDLSLQIPSTITNCTFSNPESKDTYFSRASISNCIFYPVIIYFSSDTTINYSLLSQTYDGGIENLIQVDPLYADEENNDFHLLSQEGRFYPGNGEWVIDEITSPCIDAGDPASDFLGEPIGCGGRVNMGVYGNTAQASLTNRCSGQLMGDINKDCNVNLTDIGYLMNDWLETTVIQD